MDAQPPQSSEIPVSPPKKHLSFFTSKIFLIFIIILLISFIGSSSYVLGARQIVAMNSDDADIPTVIEKILGVPMETYTNEDYGYSVQYPRDMFIYGDVSDTSDITFGERIHIIIREKDSPCDDCTLEEITSTEDVSINGVTGKKIFGLVKKIDEQDYYEPPQAFIRYEFTKGNFIYQATIYEINYYTYSLLYLKKLYPPDRKIGEIPQGELDRFKKIITSLTFSEPKRTNVPDWWADEEMASEAGDLYLPSPVPEPWNPYASEGAIFRAPTPKVTISKTPQIIAAENIKRRSDINAILNAISQYIAENNKIPTGITSSFQAISSSGADICSQIVPSYLANMPADPRIQLETKQIDCRKYLTGYEIKADASSEEITVRAPFAESDTPMSVTR